MTPASSAPSEFTRILGRVASPAPESAPAAPAPPATPTPAPAAREEEKRPARSLMPLLVALNVVVLLTIAIVAYFVLRK
jgi:hypothetical protein